MGRFAAERLGHLLLVLWAVATLTFLMFRLMPGDPTLNFLSPEFNDQMREALLRNVAPRLTLEIVLSRLALRAA